LVLHTVYFKMKCDAEPAAIEQLNTSIAHLRDVIPGITSFSWGPNCSPEGLGRGFGTGFVMTFKDVPARDAYLPHPEHQAVLPLVRSLVDDVFVYDFDLGDNGLS
jgi:Stress responsive A/B Barrel Domain